MLHQIPKSCQTNHQHHHHHHKQRQKQRQRLKEQSILKRKLLCL